MEFNQVESIFPLLDRLLVLTNSMNQCSTWYTCFPLQDKETLSKQLIGLNSLKLFSSLLSPTMH